MADRESTSDAGPAVAGARQGKEATWLFLRTLVGLLALATVLPGLFVPPDPLSFLIAMAALWLVAAVAAWWLTFAGGYARLQASGWYDPGMSSARALVLFTGVALAVKVLGTVAVDQYINGLPGYGFIEPQFRGPSGVPGDGPAPVNGTATTGPTTNGSTTASPATDLTGTAPPTTDGTATAGRDDVTPVRNRPYVYDVAVSVVALAAAYVSVYRGYAAWLLGER